MEIKIPNFNASQVLVVGDLMLDRYWHGGTGRISPEAPVPVVKIDESEERPGGAGNVALNISTLGAKPTLLGLTGKDEAAGILKRRLSTQNVNCHFVQLDNYTTITKLRVISRHQQLIRLDFEDSIEMLDGCPVQDEYERLLDGVNTIVFSDYGKGTLTFISDLVALARSAGKTIIIDPKGNDFSKYRGASLLTPNLAEFEAIVGECKSDQELVEKAKQLCTDLELEALLITRSEQGMTLVQRQDQSKKESERQAEVANEQSKPKQNYQAVHLPTRARDVFDVTGAGDTVISVIATGVASGMALIEAVKLANLAAGVVIAKLGTASVTLHELRVAIRQTTDVEQGIVSEDKLLELVQDSQLHGEKVIMTNGCFDILHAGHVTYLEQAKQLGDRLIVAVNDDDSIKRLKGETRPVNTMSRRMQVLAGLSCVDWVVGFYEDTPTRLICRIKPDVLVKGGDNDPDKIPGGDCVRENGGEVLVMDYLDNCSTTGLIRSIQKKN